jgi:hypothetical protein
LQLLSTVAVAEKDVLELNPPVGHDVDPRLAYRMKGLAVNVAV